MTINSPWISSDNTPSNEWEELFVAYLDENTNKVEYTTGSYSKGFGWCSDNDIGGNDVLFYMKIPRLSENQIVEFLDKRKGSHQ